MSEYIELAKKCGAFAFDTNVEAGSAAFTKGDVLFSRNSFITYSESLRAKDKEEIERLKQQLSAANAAIAMKDEALLQRKAADNYCRQYSHLTEAQDDCAQAQQDADEMAKKALSATPESIAAWGAEKLMPLKNKIAELENNEREYERIVGAKSYQEIADEVFWLQRQGAMLIGVLKRASTSLGAFCSDEGWAQSDMDTMDSVDAAIAAIQATAEAYDREHAAKVRKEYRKELLPKMVDRFLSWKLPKNFNPDAGISFTPKYNVGTPYEREHEPMGTNLFDAEQTKSMVAVMLGGISDEQVDTMVETLREEFRAANKKDGE